jgi:polysaccharide biosynthesis transport protein
MSDNSHGAGRHLKPVDNSSTTSLVQYDPYQQVAEQSDGIDLAEIWKAMLKRRWVVVAVVFVFLATAILSTWLTVPVYRSTAVVQITHETPRILRIDDFEATPRSMQGIQQFYQTQYEILRGRQLAENVVERLEVWDHPELTGEIRQRSLKGELQLLPRRVLRILRPTPERTRTTPVDPEIAKERAIRRAGAMLRARIQVHPRPNSRLVNVSVSSFDPSFAAQLANAVVEEYIRSTMQRRYDAGQEARVFLENQLTQMRIALERADQNLIDFAQESGIANLQERVEMARNSVRRLSERLNTSQGDLVQMQAYRRLIENGHGHDIRPIINDEQIRSLDRQKSDLMAEYAGLSQRFRDDYPAIVELRSRMNEIDTQIAERKQRITRDVLGEFQSLTMEIQTLEEAIAQQEAGILNLNQQSIQYNILRREFETNRELYDGMLQRLKEIGVAAGVHENNIAMIDSALRSSAPYLPNVGRNLFRALALGMMLGVGIALLLEFLDSSIRRIEDVERLVGRPVLGLIPMVKPREQRKKSVLNSKALERAVSHYSELHPKSAVSEAFRSLRTSLMFSTPQGMPKSILVTSPGPGDGKTTNAINLATVMAQNGARVLLIDADLRKPRMHRDFSIPQAPGLTNRIAGANGGDASASAIVPTTVEGLFVMPSGSQAPNPAELLSSERMRKIINMASRAFDHVIIDTAPLLGLADSLVLSRCVDGVIMVVGAGQTRKDSVKSSTRRLVQVQAPLLGVIMNQVDMDSPDYAYYSAYYYNYSTDPELEKRKLPRILGKTA